MPASELHAKLSQMPPRIAQIIQRFANDSKRLLQEQVIATYLFGSYARNTPTPESDIDILILVNKSTPALQWQLSGLAADYALEYDVCIAPILKDAENWKKNQTYHTLFYQNILHDGIPL